MSQFTVSKECVVPRRTRAIAWYAVAIAIACLMSLAPRTGNAQASAGITGTITDPSGAVIPNAKVTITNEETSVASNTTSSSAGTYSVKGLLPGKYTVAVDAPGFKKEVQPFDKLRVVGDLY